MAKRLLLLAAGALALTACTSEDVVDDVAVSRNVIKFENVVNELSRAADLNTNTLSSFNVFGFYTMPGNASVANEVFDNVTVTLQENGTWTYNVDDRHWVKDARYYFYAYSCGNVAKLDGAFGSFSLDMQEGLSAADRTLTIDNYLCDYRHQHDLIFASNTGATDLDKFAGILGLDKGNQAVAFQFKHLLSKIKARFTSKFPAEYEVVIRNVSVRNIRNVGDYNSSTGWQNVNRQEGEQPFVYLLNTADAAINPIKVRNAVDTEGNQVFVDTDHAYVIPYGYKGSDGAEGETSTWVNLYFEIDVMFGNERVTSKILTGKFNPNWLEGYSYIYNVELSGSTTDMDVITFTTATDEKGNIVTDWGKEESPIVIDKN